MRHLNSKIILFSLFIFFFLLSIYVYKDFGISIDEKFNREYGIINFKYILNYFGTFHTNLFDFSDVINLLNYPDKFYGAFLEIINFAIVEILLEKRDLDQIFFYRHILNHFLFLFSLVFFFNTLKTIFKEKKYAYLGVLILYSTPKIFAESFYNGKDLAFLSIFLIAFHFAVKCLKKIKIKNILLFCFFSAVAINLRITAIYLPFLLILFLYLDDKINFYKSLMILLTCFSIFFIITPFLWTNPINNFLEMFLNTINFKRMENFNIFYLGSNIEAKFLPDSYLFISFASTTPTIILILGSVAIIYLAKRIIFRIIKIEKLIYNGKIWRGIKEKYLVFTFSIIFVPVFLYYVLDSIIYNGWRHFYFLYPFYVICTIFSINIIYSKLIKTSFKSLILILISLLLFENFFNLIRLHPNQYAFYNFFYEKNANKLFDVDYWGVGNADTLRKILEIEKEKTIINVANSSFTDLQLSGKILNIDQNKRFKFIGQNYSNADYIFNNFIHEINNHYNNKYKIPENFTKIYELKAGNIVINELYKKIQ